MKGGLILFFALCALATAMVVREKRAAKNTQNVCDKTTPCGWSTSPYSPSPLQLEEQYKTALNVKKIYCVCGPGTSCKAHEGDMSPAVRILRCLPEEDKKK